MNSAALDLCEMLEAESSLGLEFAVNLFVAREPAVPDNIVVLFDTPGMPQELTLGNDVKVYYPSVQIIVRNRSYNTGYALIASIVDKLHGRGPETWNGTVYHPIVCVGDPALLEWDNVGSGRARFFVNFNLVRRRT